MTDKERLALIEKVTKASAFAWGYDHDRPQDDQIPPMMVDQQAIAKYLALAPCLRYLAHARWTRFTRANGEEGIVIRDRGEEHRFTDAEFSDFVGWLLYWNGVTSKAH